MVSPKNIIPRHIAPTVQKSLQNFPCVFINGPRQSGKTTLALNLVWPKAQPAYVNFDDAATIAIASQSPQSFLDGYDGPVILDEIQMVPELFRPLKIQVDQLRRSLGEKATGQYVLTGSANIMALPELADALVGRMIIKTLYPLSAAEIHGGKGDFVARLGKEDFAGGERQRSDLVSVMQQATFPEIRNAGEAERGQWLGSYVTTLIQRDVKQIAEVAKANLLPQLLALLASRTGSLLNEADLARSVRENAVTTKRYHTILELLFLTFSVPPWFRNLGKRLVKAPKGYIMDVNLACHMLRRNLFEVEKTDPVLFGHLVENFVATELIKQIGESAQQTPLHHFRTEDGREVDFVLEYPNQKIAGIEIKISDKITASDFNGLRELQHLAGRNFLAGVILYRGRNLLKVDNHMWALPFAALWE